MTPGRFDLALYRGDTHHWRFTLWEDDEHTVPIDLTGYVPKAEIRKASGATPVTAMGCVLTVPNIIDVTLASTNAQTVPATGVWDLQLTKGLEVLTYVAGTVTTTPDVTDSVAQTGLSAREMH